MLCVAGLLASHIANKEIMNDAKSVSRCAASVAIAKLLAKTPPTISTIMKNKQRSEAIISFRRAFLSKA